MERSRFSAAMMRSVEVGIHRSALGHTRAHLDPACAGAAGTSAVAVATAAVEAEARLSSSAAILVVVAKAARRIRRGQTSRAFPHTPSLLETSSPSTDALQSGVLVLG